MAVQRVAAAASGRVPAPSRACAVPAEGSCPWAHSRHFLGLSEVLGGSLQSLRKEPMIANCCCYYDHSSILRQVGSGEGQAIRGFRGHTAWFWWWVLLLHKAWSASQGSQALHCPSYFFCSNILSILSYLFVGMVQLSASQPCAHFFSVSFSFCLRKLSHSHFHFLLLLGWLYSGKLKCLSRYCLFSSERGSYCLLVYRYQRSGLDWSRMVYTLSALNGYWTNRQPLFRSSWNTICTAMKLFPLCWIVNCFIFNCERGCVLPGGFSWCTAKMLCFVYNFLTGEDLTSLWILENMHSISAFNHFKGRFIVPGYVSLDQSDGINKTWNCITREVSFLLIIFIITEFIRYHSALWKLVNQ